MKRDSRLIKLVLDLANTMGHSPNPEKMTIEHIANRQKLTEEEKASLIHTVKIMEDRELIVLGKPHNVSAQFWTLNRLTWDGHDYLDGLTDKAKQ